MPSTASSTSRSSRGARSPSRRSSERWASRWWRRAPRAARSSCSSFRRRSRGGRGGGRRAGPRLDSCVMIRHLPRLLLVVVALAASVSVAGPPAGTLRLCADPDNLPFSSATGPERGFYLDVGALVAARLGMTTDVVWWRSFYGARAVRNTLLADTCDAYVGLPAEAGYMDRRVTVSRPFLDVGYAIVAPPSLAFARLDDLKPRRLAVEFRTPAQSLLASKDGFNVSTFRSAERSQSRAGARPAAPAHPLRRAHDGGVLRGGHPGTERQGHASVEGDPQARGHRADPELPGVRAVVALRRSETRRAVPDHGAYK